MSFRALRRRNIKIANSRWTTYTVARCATSTTGLATAGAERHYQGPVTLQLECYLVPGFRL